MSNRRSAPKPMSQEMPKQLKNVEDMPVEMPNKCCQICQNVSKSQRNATVGITRSKAVFGESGI